VGFAGMSYQLNYDFITWDCNIRVPELWAGCTQQSRQAIYHTAHQPIVTRADVCRLPHRLDQGAAPYASGSPTNTSRATQP